jgi:predicted DsbA family dithiol-disulfide isomerase
MKIEVWSDYICPFCYIGKRHLEKALEKFPELEQVEVEFKSFELNPNQEVYSGKNINELLSSKYGMTIEEAKLANQRIGGQAAGVGLNFNFNEMKPTNTLDAHRLAKYGKTIGKQKEIIEKILYAYFTESKLISDHHVLVGIAESVGFDKDVTMDVLQDPSKYENEVRRDEALARQMGVTGVPFFLINKKYAVSGAQPTEAFVNALQKARQDESSQSNG